MNHKLNKAGNKFKNTNRYEDFECVLGHPCNDNCTITYKPLKITNIIGNIVHAEEWLYKLF